MLAGTVDFTTVPGPFEGETSRRGVSSGVGGGVSEGNDEFAGVSVRWGDSEALVVVVGGVPPPHRATAPAVTSAATQNGRKLLDVAVGPVGAIGAAQQNNRLKEHALSTQ